MNSFRVIILFAVCCSRASPATFIKSLPNITDLPEVVESYLHPVIIGGYLAYMHDFPYAVRLYVNYKKRIITCTGEAVTRRLVMTAAHCVHYGGTVLVVTGYADQTDYVKARNVNKFARYLVSKVFVHPDFNEDLLIHDVAILKLSREMTHEGYAWINPCYEKVTRPMNATIFGWGGTERNKKNNHLYGKHLAIENCTYDSNTNHTYLCLMARGICHGDSGGGLIINNLLYGIASFHEDVRHKMCYERHTYYYTALSEEKSFVKKCIESNVGVQVGWNLRIYILMLCLAMINF